jgi:hypothetical protein
MNDSKIVEIYSAANSFEAYAMTNALKAAGIKARVVGDLLGVGSEAYPIQPIGPRVWVLQEEEAQARELLKKWHAETKVPNEA